MKCLFVFNPFARKGLNEKEIEREKSVVIEEINMNEDNPEDVLYDLEDVLAVYNKLHNVNVVLDRKRLKLKNF